MIKEFLCNYLNEIKPIQMNKEAQNYVIEKLKEFLKGKQ